MSGADGSSLLVLGGQGFLGRHVVKQWLALDPAHRVVVVGRSARSDTHFTQHVVVGGRGVRMPLPPELTLPPDSRERVAYVTGDIAQPLVVDEVLARHPVDLVVHAAAALRDDPLPVLLAANVLSVVHLTRALARHRPGVRLVLVSSGSVNALAGSNDEPNPYTATKAAGEQVAAGAPGVDVVIARVHNLVGAGLQSRHLPARLALELAELQSALRENPSGTERPAALRTWSLAASRDLVDAADAARAVVAAARASTARLPSPGHLGAPLVDVGTGRSRSMREVVDLQVEAAGLTDAVAIEEDRALGGSPTDLVADTAALRQLGATTQISLETSLASMADYARNQLLATGVSESRPTSVPSA